ncbi:MAG: DNA double-strand break repair nuclease NurA [Chloroflexi bacterium]|nr:DNA double-strand break repair nuclease NurA [Chloroflexota bacterium]
MSLNFQQVREQVKKLGEGAPGREKRLQSLRELARKLLQAYAHDGPALRDKVRQAEKIDPSLRCALPVDDLLNGSFPLPSLENGIHALAADGSQIFLDRHAAVEYFLINVGVIQARLNGDAAPALHIESRLFYGDLLEAAQGYPSEERVSLLRDLRERELLAEIATQSPTPLLALTDGPLELWGARRESESREGGRSAESQSLDAYLDALGRLCDQGAAAAGYVDKPGEDYVVRLLEIASQPVEEARQRPLQGVRDADLFRALLQPGERSAVFEMQSRSARVYRQRRAELALHFFYLNVGREGRPWLARVDLPAWVVASPAMLDQTQAVLAAQCRVLGTRPYPYLLHRAHETARVTLDEKAELEMMIQNELRKAGLQPEASHKQGLKDLPGKGRQA